MTSDFRNKAVGLRAEAVAERSRLDALIASLDAVLGAPAANVEALRRSRLKGTDALVLAAITEKQASAADLVKTVKVQLAAVRKSLLRLEESKRVRVVTGTWPRKYELVK